MMYSNFVSYAKDNHQLTEQNQLLNQQNLKLQAQNEILKQLAQAAADSAKTAREAADSSAKSSKSSKVCSIISVVIAALMFIATSFSIGFEIWKFNVTLSKYEQPPTQEQQVYLTLK